jgi:hypothetical protein|nr:MAG TPA: hypothetical protein [Caudoviricetes sp.]
MIGRVNTGGGSGCILTITAVASETVTISKNGKSKSKTTDSKGIAVFRGLDTGKWTIVIVRGGVPITRVVTVTADYHVAIPLFAATINITYPAGSTCTCSDGTTTLSAPDTSGSWTCIVYNAGTWTATATDGDKSKSADVVITTDGQTENITLQYITHLFNNGDTCDAITGGWGTGSTSAGSASISGQQISIVAYAKKSFSCGPKNKIDVSEYKALSVTVDSIDNGSLSVYLYATSISNPAAKVTTSTTGTVSLDISSVSGANTVMLSFYSEKGGTVKVSEVSLM